MKVTEGIRTFLSNQRRYPLLDWYLQYGPALETQVNVAPGKGRPVAGKKQTFTDGLNNWWSIRIPKKAMSDPEWNDYELNWPLELHAEAIGTTGWHWQERRSVGFGFDFDAIAGHAKNDKNNTDEQIRLIQEAAIRLPYVSAYRSSGGAGLHLWIHLEGVLGTANHDEHAAVARCLLGKMSQDAGFPFASHLDVCGGNMWIWHRKATEENHGYELIKQGSLLNANEVPEHWRDHLVVIKGKQARVNLPGVEASEMDWYEKLCNTYRTVPLDDEHRKHIDELANLGFPANWVQDHNLLQTHTIGLRRVHEKLGLKGVYQTTSAGNNPGEANCFMYPRENGSWRVFRFGRGVAEAPTWKQDGTGYTGCIFNAELDWETSARVHGGVELPKGDGYQFKNTGEAVKALQAIGSKIEVDPKLHTRLAKVFSVENGNKSLEIQKLPDDNISTPPAGCVEDKRKAWCLSVTDVPETTDKIEDTQDFDKLVRCLANTKGDQVGWSILQANGGWGNVDSSAVKTVLQSYGHDKTHAEEIMGSMRRNPWQIINQPFETEFPGGRAWNRGSIQFSEPPASRDDGDDCNHPTWDMLLEHLGYDLNKYLRKNQWAIDAGITTGAQYLIAWIAEMLRFPFRRLPFLCFFGEFNCGKSSFHEAISLLVNKGVVLADTALTSQAGFTGELEFALLCVIEEKNIARAQGAAAKLRQLTMGQSIPIHKKGRDPVEIVNKTHWVQMTNFKDHCLIEDGDCRTMLIYVRSFEEAGMLPIPKSELLHNLRLERRAFLRTLMDFPLPDPISRLGLEVISTHHKQEAEELSRDALAQFIADSCHHVKGETIPFKDFYNQFYLSLSNEDRFFWSQERTRKSLPPRYVYGTYGGQRVVANISFQPGKHGKELIYIDGKLVEDDSNDD